MTRNFWQPGWPGESSIPKKLLLINLKIYKNENQSPENIVMKSVTPAWTSSL